MTDEAQSPHSCRGRCTKRWFLLYLCLMMVRVGDPGRGVCAHGVRSRDDPGRYRGRARENGDRDVRMLTPQFRYKTRGNLVCIYSDHATRGPHWLRAKLEQTVVRSYDHDGEHKHNTRTARRVDRHHARCPDATDAVRLQASHTILLLPALRNTYTVGGPPILFCERRIVSASR